MSPIDERSGGDLPPRQVVGSSLVLVLLQVVTVGVASWGVLGWALIPQRLNSTVQITSWSEQGATFREVGTSDGKDRQVDTRVLAQLGGERGAEGRHLLKQAWSTTLHVDNKRVYLAPSSAAWTTMAAIVGAGCVVQFRHRRRISAKGSVASS